MGSAIEGQAVLAWVCDSPISSKTVTASSARSRLRLKPHLYFRPMRQTTLCMLNYIRQVMRVRKQGINV